MRLLLDTHLPIRSAVARRRVPEGASALIEDPANTPASSVASLWEIAIKQAQGRPDFDVDPTVLRRGLLDAGYEEIPITGEHAVAAGALPPLHKDPFDRMLVAQALTEGLVLLTADATLGRYPGPARVFRTPTG